MDKVGLLQAAKDKVEIDVGNFLRSVKEITERPTSSLQQRVRILTSLRETIYEELNQIQHEYLILLAIEWLVANGHATEETEWFWNPRQKGGADEPDLRGQVRGHILVSAEITTSKAPIGVIDRRMATTLDKLSRMTGAQFYFVATLAMRSRAKTKIGKRGHAITVVELSGSAAIL